MSKIKTKISAVYVITNTVTGERYVGATTTLESRWKEHKTLLKHGKHYNPYMQECYDRDGSEAFHYEVLEYVEDRTQLFKRERFYMDLLQSEYNRHREDRTGIRLSPEIRERMRQGHLGKKLSPEHIAKAAAGRRGIKHSEEARQRMSEAQKRRFARDGYQRSDGGQFQKAS